MTYFESVAGQNAVEHIANAIGEIAARMQQQNEILTSSQDVKPW